MTLLELWLTYHNNIQTWKNELGLILTVHVLDQGASNCLDPRLSGGEKGMCRRENGAPPPPFFWNQFHPTPLRGFFCRIQTPKSVRMNKLLTIVVWLCAIISLPFLVYCFCVCSTHANWNYVRTYVPYLCNCTVHVFFQEINDCGFNCEHWCAVYGFKRSSSHVEQLRNGYREEL
jgi:hypothetical protein